MAKKNILDSLETFSDELVRALAVLESAKVDVQKIMEENSRLKIENHHLRERLNQMTAAQSDAASTKEASRHESLEEIYNEGFHVCTDSYGQHRESKDECVFCLELLDRE